MPTRRCVIESASVVHGKIYIIGGTDKNDGPLSIVEAYDVAADRWTKEEEMPTPRGFLSTSVVSGKIYAIGGSDKGPPKVAFSTVEEYTPEGWPFAVSTQGKLPTTWGEIKHSR
jgi:hypothetical protein